MDYWVWAVMLLALGFALAMLEVFIPSGGVLGVLAVCTILAAIFLGFRESLGVGFATVGAAAVGVPILVMVAMKLWPYTPLGRRLTLQSPHEEDVVPLSREQQLLAELVGRLGRARTKMLPSGTIVVDGRTWDAVSDGAAIDPGETVRVEALRGNWLVVRRAEGEAEPAAPNALDQPLESLAEPLVDPFADDEAT